MNTELLSKYSSINESLKNQLLSAGVQPNDANTLAMQIDLKKFKTGGDFALMNSVLSFREAWLNNVWLPTARKYNPDASFTMVRKSGSAASDALKEFIDGIVVNSGLGDAATLLGYQTGVSGPKVTVSSPMEQVDLGGMNKDMRGPAPGNQPAGMSWQKLALIAGGIVLAIGLIVVVARQNSGQ